MTTNVEDDERLAGLEAELEKAFGVEEGLDSSVVGVEKELSAAAAVVPEQQVLPPLGVPDTWTKEAAAEWDKLPRRIQEEALKREGEIRNGFEQIRGTKELAEFGTRFAGALKPFAADLTAMEVNPVRVVESLLKSHFDLAKASPEQKVGMFLKLAADYGVTLTQGAEGVTLKADPVVERLQTELRGVQSHLAEIAKSKDVGRHQNQEAMRQVQEFSADPENKHFNNVQDLMTRLIQSGQAQGLKDAYDKACWLEPNVRAALIAEMITGIKAAEAETQRVKAAKVASSSRVKSNESAGGSVAALVGTIEETLREELQRLRA